jgi:hypothetical protein
MASDSFLIGLAVFGGFAWGLGLGLAYDASLFVLRLRVFAAFAFGRGVSLVPRSRCACPCAVCCVCPRLRVPLL